MPGAQLWCTREPHVTHSQASFCFGGRSLLWGRICLCFLGPPQQAEPIQSDSSFLSPAWTMWLPAPCGASQQRVQLCLWATVTAPALWLCLILTFWQSFHLLFQVLWHLKKLLSLLIISILISILIKNWMEAAWVHLLDLPLGPGRIKGCSKAVLALRQGWISQRCRHDMVGNHQSPVALVTWFWTVQLWEKCTSVMCRHWPPKIFLFYGQLYLAGHFQAG